MVSDNTTWQHCRRGKPAAHFSPSRSRQVHQSEGKSYESKLEQLRQDAAKTKEQLVSENMVLTKKLDALEEFRIQREQLMLK